MATEIVYSSANTITMNLASLATSSTWVAGRESSQIDNTTNKYIDAIVRGSVKVGSASVAAGYINIYVYAGTTSVVTNNINVLDGADSAETFGNVGLRDGSTRLAYSLYVPVTTVDLVYPIPPFSVASLYGGILPPYWGLFVAHSTSANLGADNTDKFSFVGIKYEDV